MTENEDILDKVSLHVVADDTTAGAAQVGSLPQNSVATICAPGDVLDGTYQIIQLIGKGGMGEVYKATDLILGRPVAIKFLTCSLSDESVIRFQKEGQNLGKLSHPNIGAVYQCGLKESNPFIVLEYLQGITLAEIISTESPLNPYWVNKIFLQITDALYTAHSLGIVHRDLKPANIFIVKDASGRDVVKVIDFGIAKDLADAQDLTQTGVIVGSPLYMSPEQCRAEPKDHRTDIYSTGCMLFEALAGKPPFQGQNALETIQMQVAEPVPDLPKQVRFLNGIVHKSMSKKPEERYQSMKEFKQALLDTCNGNVMHFLGCAKFGQVRTYQKDVMQSMRLLFVLLGSFTVLGIAIRFIPPPYDKAVLCCAIILMIAIMVLLQRMFGSVKLKA